MKIHHVEPQKDFTLRITSPEGKLFVFDVKPYLEFEAFLPLRSYDEFRKVTNGGYFIEWSCGADLSADTLEARMIEMESYEGKTA